MGGYAFFELSDYFDDGIEILFVSGVLIETVP